MRLQVRASGIRPGEQIWFGGDRKPSRVIDAQVQEGAEKLIVLTSENGKIWYQKFDTAHVYQYVPDPVETMEEDYLDPDGNPT
jgi:hypothetical protein